MLNTLNPVWLRPLALDPVSFHLVFQAEKHLLNDQQSTSNPLQGVHFRWLGSYEGDAVRSTRIGFILWLALLIITVYGPVCEHLVWDSKLLCIGTFCFL